MADFYTREDVSKDKVSFTITVPKGDFEKEYKKLLKQELSDTDIKGFRKGKVPTDFVEPQVGGTLKIRAFEKLVPMLVNTALIEEGLEPIAPPEYKELPEFKDGEDLVFTMEITVMPDFKLGNLKKVKVKKEDTKVEEKDIDDALENIKKNHKTEAKEMNDAWAKEIGKSLHIDSIKTLKDLKEYVEEVLLNQKQHVEKHRLEDEVLKQAIEVSNIEIPEPAIKFEAEEREKAFSTDMQQKGINIDDFLKANNITIEKMRELWLKDAKQALETDVLLKIYLKERGLKVSDEDLKKKIDEIKKGAPEGTDETIFENEQWKEYIRRVEEKERAFQSLIEEVVGK